MSESAQAAMEEGMLDAAEPEAGAPEPGASPEVALGTRLKELREERGLTLADVSERLKFGSRQLEALESGRLDLLPKGALLKGFVRSYARLLDMPVDDMLARVDQAGAQAEIEPARSLQAPFPEKSSSLAGPMLRRVGAFVPAVFLVLIALGAAGWWAVRGPSIADLGSGATRADSGSRPSAMPAPSLQAAAAPAADMKEVFAAAPDSGTPPATLSPRAMRLVFRGESWVEIHQADGSLLMSQLNAKDSERIVSGTPPYSLVIGNAGLVRLEYRNADIDLKRFMRDEVARLTLE